ncbi:MAG: hypothetical protein JWM88_433 [Verrucomicrobia bacterium]|nr:hypothetical protein [Verrucomicrobiota bacterium]
MIYSKNFCCCAVRPALGVRFGLLGLGFLSVFLVPAVAGSLEFKGTVIDRPGPNEVHRYDYTATIETLVNRFGNLLAASSTIPASGGLSWIDPAGVPLQGDGRYGNPLFNTGDFILKAGYSTSPGHYRYRTVAAVHFTNGRADGAWLGKDVTGTAENTGNPSAIKLEQLDQRRLPTKGDPVQLGTGALTAERTLFSFSGARPWKFELTYNSILAAAQNDGGAVGFGWAHNFEARIQTSGPNLVLEENGSQSNLFTPQAGSPGRFTSSEDRTQHDVLAVQPDGGWLLTHRDQSARLFNSAGRLIEDRDVHGRKLVIAYDGSGRMDTITDPISGTSLLMNYLYGSSRLYAATDATGVWVSMAYNAAQMLTQITNQNGKQINFSYNADRGLLTTSDHYGAVLSSNTYDEHGRVIAQEDGITGHQPLRFSYVEEGLPGGNVYAASDTAKTVPLPLPVPQTASLTSFTRPDGQTIDYAYDEGRLISATIGGQVTTLNYDAQGTPVSVTDPAGESTPITQGITVTATDRVGAKTTYRFDPDFNLLSCTNPLNETTRYSYDARNQLVTMVDAGNRITSFGHDDAANLISMTDARGRNTAYAYDSRRNLVATTDAAGNVTQRTYDSNNNLLTCTDALEQVTRWRYNAASLPIEMTLPRGGVYHFDYTFGRVTQVTDPAGVVTKADYDADGRILFREDQQGGRTSYAYDAIGNVLTTTDPLGQATVSVYDHRNRRVKATDPLGAVTALAYDNSGNLLSATDALGNSVTYDYDGEGRLERVTDAQGRIWRRSYDVAGRVKSESDPASNVTRFEYGAAGQLVSRTDALGHRSIQAFDAEGLPYGVTDPLGRTTAYDYDDLGRVLVSRDGIGETSFGWDPLGRITRVTDPGRLSAERAVDPDGNSISVTNSMGNATNATYDAAGRITGWATPQGKTSRFAYDARGLILYASEPSGETTTFSHDPAQRLAGFVDATGAVTLSRDALGRVLTTVENGKTLSRKYDLLGRLISSSNGEGESIGYSYDSSGNLTELVYPDGRKVSYGYDAAGRLAVVTDWAGRITTYAYDAAGRVTDLLRPNGTKQLRLYDAAGQLTRLTELAPDGSTVIHAGEFRYDAGGRLTGETVIPAMDAPVPETAQTFDRDNRLTTHNGAPVAFDDDGNLLSVAAGVAPAVFRYDSRNRLTSAGDITYNYDAENRRISQTGPSGSTRYVVNPAEPLDQVLMRVTPDGTKTYYVYGSGLLHEETGATVAYYHYNRRGDTIALTDNNGAVTDRAGYGPYGEVISREGKTGTPFLFNGRWGVQTDGNGLTYHRARYYHPGLRRFLNQDRNAGGIEVPATLNRFAYTRGNPIGFMDPSGNYDSDVHRDLTYSLAVRAGFAPEDAEIIAGADQALDESLMAGPFLNPFARRKFHFTTPERREEMLREANESGDLSSFGYYLHAEQDSFSHQDGLTDRNGEPDGWILGHLFAGHSRDQTYLRPELALNMAERTYQQLRMFAERKNGKKTCDDWENIWPEVDEWVRIERK